MSDRLGSATDHCTAQTESPLTGSGAVITGRDTRELLHPHSRERLPPLKPCRGYRDYHSNLSTLIALRLEPASESPILEDLGHALDHPARPLFIGRKSCLPSRRLFAGWQDGENILQALQRAPCLDNDGESLRIQWPDGEGELQGDRVLDLCDERNWTSGVHGGWRPVREGAFKLGEAGS